MKSYLAAMRKWATFSGRSSRKECWLFVMFMFLLSVLAACLDAALGTGQLTNASGSHPGLIFSFWYLLHLIPSLSLSIRRLHDTDRSGWWLLIGLTGLGNLVLMVFMCLRGTVGPNRYGPDPYARPGGDHVEPVLADPRSEFYAPTMASLREVSPVRPAVPRNRDSVVESDPISEIERLAYLRQDGSISDAEFEVLKARALARAR